MIALESGIKNKRDEGMLVLWQKGELKRMRFSAIIVKLYAFRSLRRFCLAAAHRREGGQFFSETLRNILIAYHGVSIGAYSYGECLRPESFPSGVLVGRYVSVADGVKIFVRNHPFDRLSMHPFFYNSKLGWIEKDSISSGSLDIWHDSWIGANVIVTPGCSRIGLGAVIGAGSVVTKNVDDFAVMAGNPARKIRQRFPEDCCEIIRKSRWWEFSIGECARYMPDMMSPLPENPYRHPLIEHALRLK
jgi:virginiamycin A acetyltransferase